MPKKVMIISARGEESFQPEQVKRIKSVAEARFLARLDPMSKEELINSAAEADILAVTRRSVKMLDAEILSSLPLLAGLAVYSTGYEWIDHYYLEKHGIDLSYLKHYSTISVAEHIMGMMLTMSRRMHLSSDKVRGLVPEDVSLCGWELRGKKLGIIGLGRIGEKTAQLASAFGMEIYYHDLDLKQTEIAAYLSLEELLNSCDLISLSASRKYMEPPILTYERISWIKRGACLINAGRPELADTEAVIKAIKESRLVGYAVDEVLDKSLLKGLNDFGRVFQTGHTAWYSQEAIARGTEEWTENICAMAAGTPVNTVGGEDGKD